MIDTPRFTDLFIKRPVLASVISLLLLLLGLQSLMTLSIRQYPYMEDAIVTVTTSYPGASAELIQSFITTPLQQVVAGADGIDYLTSTSETGTSTITANLRLGYSADTAMMEIMAAVDQVTNQLPTEAQQPVIAKARSNGSELLYLGFFSDTMNNEQITDYLTRVIQPQLVTVEGVADAGILGEKQFSMRIWLDPVKMAAYAITAEDIQKAIEDSNVQSAAGQVEGEWVLSNVRANTSLSSTEEFANIVVRQTESTLVHLKDVATVELGASTTDSYVAYNGEPATYVGIQASSTANPLAVAKNIHALIPTLKGQLPPDLDVRVVYDSTTFITASIDEVITTLIESSLIVIGVVFLFLGNLRTVMIPVITIPLSMIGVMFFLNMMGYSLNLLTLLAMILAIGLVIDDAIVVVENIQRHIEMGEDKLTAALRGAREIATPIIAMTLTLASVYAPIGFTAGLTGALFKEFAFTLAGAVVVSGCIALTLSPMMCSKILPGRRAETRYTLWLDNQFSKLQKIYQRRIEKNLSNRPVTLLFAFAVLISVPVLFLNCEQALAPEEDNGVLFITSTPPMYANIDYLNHYTIEMVSELGKLPQAQNTFMVNSDPSTSLAGLVLKPWDERKKSLFAIQKEVQDAILPEITGLKSFAFIMPSLPGSGGGLPIQFVLQSTGGYDQLGEVADELVRRAEASGLFLFIDSTLTFDKPETLVKIDREKAAMLGVSIESIGNTLSMMLSGNYLDWFSIQGRSYKVIPKVDRDYRFDSSWLNRYYVRAGNDLIPLSALVTIETTSTPNQLTQFQQLNATTIQASTISGVTVGQALDWLAKTSTEIAPTGFSHDYSGGSRQFMTEGNTLIYAFIMALFVIYLVLAAQFESFRDPLVVMMTVPMSISGALIPLMYGGLFEDFLGIEVSMNIYTQIGLVTLIGLISKHGILIVDFANNEQAAGKTLNEAIVTAAAVRLRPVLMTTAAMVFGIMPLLFATGAGAVSRFNIGLVITVGMAIGTLFTLFVIPVMYSTLASKEQPAASTPTKAPSQPTVRVEASRSETIPKPP